MYTKHILDLYEMGAFKFGEFQLKSGMLSPIYVDLRLLVSAPQVLKEIAHSLQKKVEDLSYDCMCGVPYTALPIATALSLSSGKPMVMRRKEAKNYGTKQLIEGSFKKGERCLVVEDLITSGMSLFETIEPLEEVGLEVKEVVLILDREQGGKKRLADKGYRVQSLFTLSDVLETLVEHQKIEGETKEKVLTFIKENQV